MRSCVSATTKLDSAYISIRGSDGPASAVYGEKKGEESSVLDSIHGGSSDGCLCYGIRWREGGSVSKLSSMLSLIRQRV